MAWSNCTKTLLVSFGFDERFAVRAVSDHRPCRILAVALYTGRDAWSRVERAFSQLRVFSSSLSAEAVLVAVPYEGEPLSKLVYSLGRILGAHIREALGQGELVALLSGGPRLLVLGLYVLLSMLPAEYAEKIVIRVEGEGFNALVEEPLQSLRPIGLDELDRKLLALLVERSEAGLGVSEASRILGAAKSTIHRRLQALAREGVVTRSEENARYYPSSRAFLLAALHYLLD